jgi:hypothetical protein
LGESGVEYFWLEKEEDRAAESRSGGWRGGEKERDEIMRWWSVSLGGAGFFIALWAYVDDGQPRIYGDTFPLALWINNASPFLRSHWVFFELGPSSIALLGSRRWVGTPEPANAAGGISGAAYANDVHIFRLSGYAVVHNMNLSLMSGFCRR